MNESFEHINKGFSSIYEEYEDLYQHNFIDIAQRKCIRNHVNHYLKPHHKILEINSGSGIDAVYFAQKGHPVLATDIAFASEKIISEKIQKLGLTNLRFQKNSYTTLNSIKNEKFDHIFSNYGGLNFTDDLPAVFKQFDSLLNPKGFVTLVIMPPFYPWEMVSFLTGNKNAFRRFNKNGVTANIKNYAVKTYYHTPTQVKKAFGKNFNHIKTRNIGTFYPSHHFYSLQKYKKLISKLVQFDTWINNFSFMMKGIGDYFIITFQKTS